MTRTDLRRERARIGVAIAWLLISVIIIVWYDRTFSKTAFDWFIYASWGFNAGAAVITLGDALGFAYTRYLRVATAELPVWGAISLEDNCVFMNSNLARVPPQEFLESLQRNGDSSVFNVGYLFQVWERYFTSAIPVDPMASIMSRCLRDMMKRSMRDAELGVTRTAFPVGVGLMTVEESWSRTAHDIDESQFQNTEGASRT